jgi:AraC family transcriptional regulator
MSSSQIDCIDAVSGKKRDTRFAQYDSAELPGAQKHSLETFRNAIADLLYAVSRVFQEKPEEAHGYVSRAAELLRTDPTSEIKGRFLSEIESAAPQTARGGLAPWIVRKLSTYIETHLDSAICSVDLAVIAELSVSHFSRAFRKSFDEPPHSYVMRRRIERAQGLMLQTNLSLAQIAIGCGLSDQAHFNKSFRRFVGQSPGAWRRARVIGPR